MIGIGINIVTRNIYTYPIPKEYIKMLLGLVELSWKYRILTLPATRRSIREEIRPFDYTIEAGNSALHFERLNGKLTAP